MQPFFGATPPSVRDVIVELERRGLIIRVPHQPAASPSQARRRIARRRQAIKTTVSGWQRLWLKTSLHWPSRVDAEGYSLSM
jgi:hypothetical protein